MNCDQIREQIPECLAGRLDPDGRDRLMAHVEGCSACRAELAELGAVWRTFESLGAPEPDRAMKARFLETLEAYQMGMRAALPAATPKTWVWWPSRPLWQALAAALLLLVGAAGGVYAVASRQAARSGSEIAQLSGQVESLRQLVALSMMQQDSASARLRGVSYSNQMVRPDRQVEQALLYAVNHDGNVNVRLSAVDALSRFAGNADIRRGLADAIPLQDSALVQIALIDLLTESRDPAMAPALRKLAADRQVDEAVRQRAASAIQQLEAYK